MPVTPYHFGPNGTVALILRRYLDFPLMILANIAVDIEVPVLHFIKISGPHHRFTHSLLFGGLLGVLIGSIAYYLWPRFSSIWGFFKIPFQLSLWKLIVSGILGCWLHAIFDSIYHWEIQLFRPLKGHFLYGIVTHEQLKIFCLFCWLILIVMYIISIKKRGVK